MPVATRRRGGPFGVLGRGWVVGFVAKRALWRPKVVWGQWSAAQGAVESRSLMGGPLGRVNALRVVKGEMGPRRGERREKKVGRRRGKGKKKKREGKLGQHLGPGGRVGGSPS